MTVDVRSYTVNVSDPNGYCKRYAETFGYHAHSSGDVTAIEVHAENEFDAAERVRSLFSEDGGVDVLYVFE